MATTVLVDLSVQDHVGPLMKAAADMIALGVPADRVPEFPSESVRTEVVQPKSNSVVRAILLPTPQLVMWIAAIACELGNHIAETNNALTER